MYEVPVRMLGHRYGAVCVRAFARQYSLTGACSIERHEDMPDSSKAVQGVYDLSDR